MSRSPQLLLHFCSGRGRGGGQLCKLQGDQGSGTPAWPGVAPGGGGAQALAAATMCPGRRLPACRDRVTRAGCGRGCSTLQHHRAPCAFRAGTEHQVRGGDGREPDGPAPSSFQHQAGRKVNPTPAAPAKFEPGKTEYALPLLARVASSLSHAHVESGCKCRVPSPLCAHHFLSPLIQSDVSQAGNPGQSQHSGFQAPRT